MFSNEVNTSLSSREVRRVSNREKRTLYCAWEGFLFTTCAVDKRARISSTRSLSALGVSRGNSEEVGVLEAAWVLLLVF